MARPHKEDAKDLAKLQRQQNANQDLTTKLKRIRALHVTAYNVSVAVEKTSVEFFYAVGDILEGQLPAQLNLQVISRTEFLKELEDG